MLVITDLRAGYGAADVLQGCSFSVPDGSIVAIIGPNGAGKTTLLRTTSGLLHPRSGHIQLAGIRIDSLDTEEIVRRGVVHVPEGRHVFYDLTVWENLRLGAFTQREKRAIHEGIEHALNVFPRLRERLKQKAGTLSGGEQQMLAIGRGLAANPRLLLLDEPSLGLAPLLREHVFSKIEEINREGATILLAEQNAAAALEIAERGYVLQGGKVVLEGDRAALYGDPLVQRHYLGVG